LVIIYYTNGPQGQVC